MYSLFASSKFSKNAKKLLKNNSRLKQQLEKTLTLLIANPKHPSLRLHKLCGSDNYSVSVNMSIRLILRIKQKKKIIFLTNIGNHNQVY